MENNQIVLNDEIINKAKEGDRNALALLCKKSMQSAYFMALRILKNEADAEDIVSESMITVIEKIGYLKDAKAYEAWVNRIVINKCYDYIKKMKPVLCGDYSEEYIDNAELEEYNKEFLPEEFAVDREKRKVLMDIIKDVTNEMEMMSIIMFYYNDESINSIANSMNCAEITVKKRLASGRKKIKEGIERKYGKGVVFMATGIITVLSQVMKAEASETTIPASAVANIMTAAGNAATGISNMQNTNGGMTMNNIAKKGLSGGAKAGICCGVAATVAAVGIGIALIFGGNDSNIDDDYGINGGTTINIEAENDTTTSDETSGKEDVTTQKITTEETTTEETTTKKTFVPEVFEQYEVDDSGFVAPSVHTEANEECTFIWNHTEKDMLDWIHNNYIAKDKYNYIVENNTGINIFDERSVLVYATLENEDRIQSIIKSESYNKNSVSNVQFNYKSKELSKVILELSKFIEYMGLKEYTEQIIHNNYSMTISTENDLGYYEITTNYYVSDYDETYSLTVTIKYYDYQYREEMAIDGVVPETMETWDDYYNLSDIYTNTSFDTSNSEAMAKDIGKYAVDIGMNNTLKYAGVYCHNFKYTYNSESTEIKPEDVYLRYIFEGMDSEDDEYLLDGKQTVSFSMNYDDTELVTSYIFVDLTPIYDEDRDYESGLNDDDIANLTNKRLQILKQIQTHINITKEPLIDIYKKDEPLRIEYPEEGKEYTIYNEFDHLCLVIR